MEVQSERQQWLICLCGTVTVAFKTPHLFERFFTRFRGGGFLGTFDSTKEHLRHMLLSIMKNVIVSHQIVGSYSDVVPKLGTGATLT